MKKRRAGIVKSIGDPATAAAPAESGPRLLGRRRFVVGGLIGAVGPVGLAGCAAPEFGGAKPVERMPGPVARLSAADLALVDRVTWGVDSAAIAQRSGRSRSDYLEAQLHPAASAALPPAAQAQIDALLLHQKPMQAWVVEMEQRRRESEAVGDVDAKKAARQAYQQAMTGLARDAASETLLRALYAPNQLQEQLAWFWFNHFNVHQYKANLRAMVGDYQGRLRGLALGKFRDLLIASATHPAMLRYLDNQQNAAGRINENYARELLELHTLGVDGGYTQKDVQELARVLTGVASSFGDTPSNAGSARRPLRVDEQGMRFDPARHDSGEKRVLGETIAGGGFDELIGQLTRLARHPATARHISQRLAMYFVADAPPAALVERMSRSFTASDGDIATTLGTLFAAPEFEASLGKKLKDPIHYVVSAVRLAYDGRVVLNTAPMLGWLNRLGEGLYNRQTPDGYPLDAAAWSGSGQMSTRFEIARAIGAGGAGLFRADGAPAEAPRPPQLANAVYLDTLGPTLGTKTRVALDAAAAPPEWNALLLSAPEFMYR